MGYGSSLNVITMVFLLVSRAVPPLGGPRTAPERSAGAARAAKAQRGDERLFDSIFEHREVREVCTQTCTVSVVPGSCVRVCGVGGGVGSDIHIGHVQALSP